MWVFLIIIINLDSFLYVLNCVQPTPALYDLGRGPLEMENHLPINDFFSLIPIDKQHNCENGMCDHIFDVVREYIYDKTIVGGTTKTAEAIYQTFEDRLKNSYAFDTFGIDLPSKGLKTEKLHSKEKQALMYYAPIAAGDLLPKPVVDYLWCKFV